MNFNKFINSDYLKSNPLCGIDTYKDELNLATGACTRKIKKLVLTGQEDITSGHLERSLFNIKVSGYLKTATITVVCSHYNPQANVSEWGLVLDKRTAFHTGVLSTLLYIRDSTYSTVDDFKIYLQQQYANGTPVAVWYILETPTTETITVPSGLSGTEEGYLIQDGTPTPTNPIYPTANTVEKWFDSPNYIMGTDTDTIATLPADIYVNDTTATVGLKGNMEQSGTPTPTTPIQPQECGERTGNLWDESYTNISTTLTYKSFYVGDGIFTASTDCPISYPSGSSSLFFIAGNVSTGASSENNLYNNRARTVESINGYVTIAYRITGSVNPNDYNTMINSGSTALPYEPYGVKIPILNNSTTYNKYLGEVESTRRIRKLVLTGEESYTYQSAYSRFYFGLTDAYYSGTTRTTLCYCSHYQSIYDGRGIDDVPNESIYITTSYDLTTFNIKTTDYTSETDFKTYLAQQYAAGTPVCIWYILATPQTAVVNEPLRKIGDYADIVSGITIPTTAGANTLSIGTTLQPSEVTATYKGWHPVADVHERESGAWT